MIKICLVGASGRVGRTAYKSLLGDENFQIVFGVDAFPATDLPFPVYSNFENCPLDADVIIDFSAPSSLDSILDYAVKNGVRCVIATTGHTEEQMKRIEYASKSIAIFKSANMSLGINLLSNLSKEATKFLGESYDIEIVETHHNKKLDAPSGTALLIANAISEARPLVPTFGRHESAKRRESSEIGIHAIRGGTVVGKHDVMFLGTGERITLSHEAESKEVFVKGALRASEYLMTKQSGLYDMNSILGSYYAVTTVSAEDNVSLIAFPSISSTDFLTLLRKIKDCDVNIDMISQNANDDGTLAVSFSLSDDDLARVEKMTDIEHKCIVGTVKMTAEGAGMEHQSGVALDVLSQLKGAGAKIYAITTSETKISCAINSDAKADAEIALRNYYGI